jgi:DNA-binding IclR family transcriptional regulator
VEVGVAVKKRKRAAAAAAAPVKDGPKKHRTIDRVTEILEQVVYNPGMTFSDLVKVLGAAKSSVHGFLSGLLANGWLYTDNGRFYLGPAVYGLTLASGQIRAGLVTTQDLMRIYEESKVAAFLGVRAGDHLIYVAEAGSDAVTGYDARTNIRRTLLATAGGKALLAQMSDAERESYLRRRAGAEADLVPPFLDELSEIRRSRIATNSRKNDTRFAIATTVHDRSGAAIASITLTGETALVKPRAGKLSKLLLSHVEAMQARAPGAAQDR